MVQCVAVWCSVVQCDAALVVHYVCFPMRVFSNVRVFQCKYFPMCVFSDVPDAFSDVCVNVRVYTRVAYSLSRVSEKSVFSLFSRVDLHECRVESFV